MGTTTHGPGLVAAGALALPAVLDYPPGARAPQAHGPPRSDAKAWVPRQFRGAGEVEA
jgi:hypothetical protein